MCWISVRNKNNNVLVKARSERGETATTKTVTTTRLTGTTICSTRFWGSKLCKILCAYLLCTTPYIAALVSDQPLSVRMTLRAGAIYSWGDSTVTIGGETTFADNSAADDGGE